MDITPIRSSSRRSSILGPDDSTPSPPSTPELFQAQYAVARQQLDFEETPAVMQSIPLPGPPEFQGIPPPPMIQIPLGSLNTLANIPGGLLTVQGFRPIESINMQENISPTRYRNYPPPPMQEQVDQKMNEEEERKWEDKMKNLRRMR
jgi:hypothetical protein